MLVFLFLLHGMSSVSENSKNDGVVWMIKRVCAFEY
jgi:hypothetical protein